jgi:hypothetical protein
MRLTVLGGCGAWPGAGQACSGYLVEHDGFRVLRDDPAPALPVHVLPGAADRVLALDRPGLLDDAYEPREFTADTARHLSSALQAGEHAARAGAGRLLLTHLLPGTSPEAAVAAAGRAYPGEVEVARGGLTADLG